MTRLRLMTSLRRTALALVALTLGLAGVGITAPGHAAVQPSSTVVSRSASGTGAVTRTETIVRQSYAADGSTTQVDRRTVRLGVSATTNLRGRQELNVTWTGAHPTGGLVSDVNSSAGVNEEYPFVLLECRGVDSTSVPAARQISPETCWTQTSVERYNSNLNTTYPAWRSDAFETDANRARIVGAPSPRPHACPRAAAAERWIPMIAANGTVYQGGDFGCAGQAPEASNIGGTGLPSNATYGITGTDGDGSAEFSAWTEDEDATLGCSSSVPCALVAIPIMGISCDGYGSQLPAADRPDSATGSDAQAQCQSPDVFSPGQIAVPGTQPNLATSGALWWSASNWRNRITVPLQFAVSSNVCSVVSKEKPLAIYGSTLLNELTAQWEPKFCTDEKLFPFVHVQTAEDSARTLLNVGNVEGAFGSLMPDGGFGKPVVQAPIAVTGFAISYVIDDANGRPYARLRLDPRLLAKLLSQSYPANSIGKGSDPAIAANPVNITEDPEFQALNPGLPHYTAVEAASTLLTLSSDADMVYALTSYLNDDPDARAFLDGKADPWGMVVNPAYKHVQLPVYSWPLQDNNLATSAYISGGNNPCYTHSPGPYLSLVANPTGFVSTIVLNMQYAISNVGIACPNGDPNDVSTLKLSTQGRQQPGFRFVLGIVPLSSIARYNLTAASLRSGPSPTTAGTAASRAADTVSAGTYVAPDNAGLRAAAALFTADKADKTWKVDYDALQTAAARTAYPGTLPVYADIPTRGLTAADASKFASFLTYAAGTGQTPGLLNGQLPPGYLPLTRANGLAALAGYTARAALAVKAQKGFVPSLDAADDVTTPTSQGGTGPSSPSAPVPGATPGSPTGSPAVGAAAAPQTSVALFRTVGHASPLGRLGLPLMLLTFFLLGAAGMLLRWSEVIVPVVVSAARVARPRTSGKRKGSS
ncbi:MAG: hypothetical protein JWR52_3561 [Marmoricola sp.]|nr:hypothetical protein [Marmoricola sp.]